MSKYFSRRSVSNDPVARLLRDVPEREQPLGRLERLGPGALSIPELLQLLLGRGADPLLPLHLVTPWGSLNAMANASPLDLMRVNGMTRLRSARIRAALELGKRALLEQHTEDPIIKSPQDLADLLLPEMSGLPQEQMRVVFLNTRHHVLGAATAYQGSLHTTVLRIADLFREAVRCNAAAIAIAHNHPSGEPTPSPEDVAVTRELVKAGKILDVEVIDHIVIGNAQRWVSLKERGLGF